MFKGKFKPQFSKKSIIFIAIFAVILIIDLVTKYYAAAYGWNKILIKGVLEVHYTRNTGMAFSFLADKSWGQAFLIAFSAIMSVAIIVIILFLPERFTILKLSLYMILAGAIGNLVDRAAYGYVRDFLWMVIPGATCNVADIFIVVGTFLAVIDLLFLNEFAAFPLTKKAKKIQAERRKAEEEKKSQSLNDDAPSESIPDAANSDGAAEDKEE
ncbi:MAG: signal peptidase II [Clostridia bacterium]|nr:signal peptidase II [Clostridia bacterium]